MPYALQCQLRASGCTQLVRSAASPWIRDDELLRPQRLLRELAATLAGCRQQSFLAAHAPQLVPLHVYQPPPSPWLLVLRAEQFGVLAFRPFPAVLVMQLPAHGSFQPILAAAALACPASTHKPAPSFHLAWQQSLHGELCQPQCGVLATHAVAERELLGDGCD